MAACAQYRWRASQQEGSDGTRYAAEPARWRATAPGLPGLREPLRPGPPLGGLLEPGGGQPLPAGRATATAERLPGVGRAIVRPADAGGARGVRALATDARPAAARRRAGPEP